MYDKTNSQKIAEFHYAMGTRVPSRPQLLPKKTIELRQRLIREKYEQTMREMDTLAKTNANLVPLMEELAELLYVVYGTFVQFGVDADAVLEEVHRAKMQKTMREPAWGDESLLGSKDSTSKKADIAGVISRLQDSDYIMSDPWLAKK